MHIRKGIVVLAATLAMYLGSSLASQQLETCMHTHLEEEQPVLTQTAAPFNFWTNLRSFSWGVFIGVPGNILHDKVKVCYKDLGATLTTIKTAYNNYVSFPDRTAEELTGDISAVFSAASIAASSCGAAGQEVTYKVGEFSALLAFFVLSEDAINVGNFYDAGLNLGFAISRILA